MVIMSIMERKEKIFKQCPMCAAIWLNRQSFLSDDSLVINGYQADFDDLGAGLFYFTHHVDNCLSTMVVRVKYFFDLNPNQPYPQRKTLTQECPKHCLDSSNIEPCQAHCECAYVRDLIHILENYKATEHQPGHT